MKSYLKGLLLCIFVNISHGLGVDYIVILLRENVFSECENYPQNYIPLVFDLTNLTFQYQSDEVINVKGKLEFLLDLPPTQEINLQINLLKKERSEWVSTIYSIQRDNLCDSLFSPTEVWYDYVKDIPADLRACPPEKGTVYDIDLDLETEIKNSQDRNREGTYKLEANLAFGPESNNFICFNILFDLSRI